jgi:Dna[CI] antecedent, DciA
MPSSYAAGRRKKEDRPAAQAPRRVPGHAPGQALGVGQALDRSEPFTGLMQRLAQSQRCYAAIKPLLPPALQDVVRSGPLDEGQWTLLADSAAAAAKLRQMLPDLQQALGAQGMGSLTIRVKVSPRR